MSIKFFRGILFAILMLCSIFFTKSSSEGAPAYGINVYSGEFFVFIPDTDYPGTWNVINNTTGEFAGFFAADFAGIDFTKLYAINDTYKQLFSIDTTTGAKTLIGACNPLAGHNWSGMSWDVTTETMYASSTNFSVSAIYTVDITSGTVTLIGTIANAPAIMDIAINAGGQMYALCINTDSLFSINKNTGTATLIGPLNIDANYVQGLDFEEESNTLYWTFYSGIGDGALRTIDITTGESILIGDFPGNVQISCIAFATGGISEYALPYCEGFEEQAWPPEGWTLYQIGESIYNWIQTSFACEGSYSAYHDDWSDDNDSWLVSPPIVLPGDAGTITLSFCEKNSFVPTWYDYSGVLISTGSGDPEDGDFVELYESNISLTDWTAKEIDISAYAGNLVYIAFNYQGNFAHEWWVDNFCVSSEDNTEEYTLAVNSTTGGSVTEPGEGTFNYEENAIVDITAQTDTGYKFVAWTGTGVDAGKVADPDEPSTTITMDENYSVTANFAEKACPFFGTGGGDSSCFIATAAYGTPMASEVIKLRSFRDRHLLTNRAGRMFVRWYYKHGPSYANYIRRRPAARAFVRTLLRPLAWLVSLR